MRVAIPTRDGRIEPVFSRAEEYTIYDVEIELVKSKVVVPIGKKELGNFLMDEAINIVICGRIRSGSRNVLRLKRVELIYGVSGEADDIMIRYLSGERLGDIDENAFWSKDVEGLE
ncbi:NifB/NifX family molybdenum-iron cluster-binding protein [Anaerotignum sp. MB30-C6]|uniref:NifB/NifX family molybdenum-iron cluster-binding protein n=1 Tax=Anaerotignum sp. MB30-C6 TaxID=3070814 RepID=UPI0027DAD1AA|nr:NifB/NifX family molybdenum-iron cluster-binding protein [Anaerotignum sp. MB30-C6]WMI81385.1 NifB/NifX family molybdenum-iron cluster-binding protein [Anaerotignum sp. MB30-C6]